MDPSTDPIPAPLAAAHAFDAARAAFLAAFAQVPDAALSYLPEGDEYALGGLLMHLGNPLPRYTVLLARLIEARAAGVNPWSEDEEQSYRALREEAQAARPTEADRARLLNLLDSAHAQFRARLVAFPPERFDLEVPVLYPHNPEPSPTSAHAVAGWMIDHYQDHTTQVQAMLANWLEQHPT